MTPAFVDIAFAVRGTTLPSDHRALLAEALERELPFLAADPRCGVHRLKLAQDWVSPRTRLVLRVPVERAGEVLGLAGRELDLAGHRLAIGAGHARPLLAHTTLYAHFVAADVADEAAFLAAAEGELGRIGVRGRAICGRWQSLEAHALVGCSLMVDQLSPEDALVVLESGLGRHRRLGCGLFVPHKTSAAVGAT
jgi:CRISPR-associated protein Cas6